MRIVLIATVTLALAFAAIPSPASAREPITTVCVPPHSLNGACVGNVDGQACAWYWGGANHSSVCTGSAGTHVCSNHLFGQGWVCDPDYVGPAIQAPPPICVPPYSLNQACIVFVTNGVCFATGGGPVYSYVCAFTDGRVVSCSNSLYSPVYGEGDHCLGDPMP